MHARLDRRELLGGAVLGAGAWLVPAPRFAIPFRISLAQWSLNRSLRGLGGEERLDPLDFAATARELGLGAIEYVNTFYTDRIGDAAYRRELRRRADGEGVRSLLIMCDGLGRLGDADTAARRQAVENHRPWLDLASELGCHAIRVNAASSGTYDEQQARAADGLRALAEIATRQDLDVLVENHGGLSSNGAWLAGVMQRVGHLRCGTLPDFGNFRISAGEEYDRYRGVAELMPWAKAVSAKSHAFDESGEETGTDYHRMLRIVHGAGYRGHVGIEFEGRAPGERDGIRLTLALLRRVRRELVS